MSLFEWPCTRREAHGPHRGQTDKDEEGRNAGVEREIDCPGVKAHPETMIGRPVVPSVDPYGLAQNA